MKNLRNILGALCPILIFLVGPVFTADPYICGDANSDGSINVGDAVYLINYVFKGGPAPEDGCCDDCEVGQTQPCYTGPPATEGEGECVSGIQNCIAGVWGICVGEILPQDEECDGLDNDCDGAIDENIQAQPCPNQDGVCAGSFRSCQGGAWQVCGPTEYGPDYEPVETSCDGLDNDCDGQVDEGFYNLGEPCWVGEGECSRQGFYVCHPSGMGTICNVEPGSPSSEVCDGLDNDCDGAVDEGDPGGGILCNTGISGVCAQGTTHCVSGSITCTQDQSPTPEICDGLDNDCDGQADEGNPEGGGACSTGLPGVCATGTLHCVGGVLTCVQDQAASPEDCYDGLDNDCDGLTDMADPDCP